jgi:hypothetical protein
MKSKNALRPQYLLKTPILEIRWYRGKRLVAYTEIPCRNKKQFREIKSTMRGSS